jgi:monoamine oxidase
LYDELDEESIMTGTKVTTIRTGKKKVEVVTDKGTFTGQHVIVTASLGVLKSGMITFEPPLP